jgi:thioredoxin reductase
MARDSIDLAIIGSGPNGLYACFRFRELFPNWNIAIFERENSVCANIRSYPNVKWHSKMAKLKLPSTLNFYIDDEINPNSYEIASYYQEFANEHQLPINFNHELISIGRGVDVESQGGLSASTILNFVTEGETIQISCRYAILSTGIYSGVNKLSIQNEKIQYGYSLATKGKNLVLVGSGNSAIDFVINLLPHNQITWILRGEQWASVFETISSEFDMVFRNFNKNLTIIRNSTISGFNEDNSMNLSNGMVLDGFDSCHVLIGYSPRNSLKNGFDFDFESECLSLTSEFETSQSNVFAFGSIMAIWDKQQGFVAPTYVDNGNESKLQVIIDSISRREVGRIFGSNKVIKQQSQSSANSSPQKRRIFWGYLPINETVIHHTDSNIKAIFKVISKSKHLIEKLFTR